MTTDDLKILAEAERIITDAAEGEARTQSAPKPYAYHVAYAHRTGFGRATVRTTLPANNPEGVQALEDAVQALDPELGNCVVISYQRYDGTASS